MTKKVMVLLGLLAVVSVVLCAMRCADYYVT